jgi:hypothetical protein
LKEPAKTPRTTECNGTELEVSDGEDTTVPKPPTISQAMKEIVNLHQCALHPGKVCYDDGIIHRELDMRDQGNWASLTVCFVYT